MNQEERIQKIKDIIEEFEDSQFNLDEIVREAYRGQLEGWYHVIFFHVDRKRFSLGLVSSGHAYQPERNIDGDEIVADIFKIPYHKFVSVVAGGNFDLLDYENCPELQDFDIPELHDFNISDVIKNFQKFQEEDEYLSWYSFLSDEYPTLLEVLEEIDKEAEIDDLVSEFRVANEDFDEKFREYLESYFNVTTSD